MIFFKVRFNSSLALVLTATLLISCLEKKPGAPPLVGLENDDIIKSIEKEIAGLEVDKLKMQERLDSINKEIEENALRPKALEFFRRDYFNYEKMARQIDQRLNYYKIRKALREQDLKDRIQKKTLTQEALGQESIDHKVQLQAQVQKYPWRALPPLKKKGESDAKDSSHQSQEDKAAEEKAPPSSKH
jgi:predicted unusual protein kinase regulating ubiquinone biosynthesis (AarF/ABC1/UbiB family)